jgi:hypothetical protein
VIQAFAPFYQVTLFRIAVASLAIGCTASTPIQSPVIVPVAGHVRAVVDRWGPSCPTPKPIYPRAWDNTLADTVVVFASPFDPDTIASLFGVSRRDDGGYWYDYQGRGGDGSEGYPGSSVDSVRVGRWLVIAGQYETMTYVDDIELPADSSGRIAPEHSRQSWFYAFAPTKGECAVVLAWRSPSVGSYRGPRYNEREIDPDSLVAFISRVRWRER